MFVDLFRLIRLNLDKRLPHVIEGSRFFFKVLRQVPKQAFRFTTTSLFLGNFAIRWGNIHGHDGIIMVMPLRFFDWMMLLTIFLSSNRFQTRSPVHEFVDQWVDCRLQHDFQPNSLNLLN